MQIACIEADRSAIVVDWNSGGRPDMKYVKRQKLIYVEYFVRELYNIPQLLYDAFILRSIKLYSKHNKLLWHRWWCSRARGITPTFGAPSAHPSLWWAATCHVRTLLPGPDGVRSWQVLQLLYNSISAKHTRT